MRKDKIYKHIVTSILYCSIDFVMEDIEYSATVTGVDIAGNIGEESDPVFFMQAVSISNIFVFK